MRVELLELCRQLEYCSKALESLIYSENYGERGKALLRMAHCMLRSSSQIISYVVNQRDADNSP